jgi:hypothetical protein
VGGLQVEGRGRAKSGPFHAIPAVYEMCTVITSETVPSSRSVMVASDVNCTSMTSAVHIGLGQEPGGTVGASDSIVNLN